MSTHFMTATSDLYEPAKRDAQYGKNVAQYLLDLHDSKATFDFCGGMMFQLVLSDMLKDHLTKVAVDESKDQPFIHDSSKMRMFRIPEYTQSADSDNARLFHGREIRQVPDATGGMGMVLQLSYAGGNDPEGWTPQEVEGYDGWGHDVGRTWRKGDRLEKEGFKSFREDFGKDAFSLHHRFYLHYDGSNKMWLSAEDGCEGTPAEARNFLSNLFGR
eukprot:CAMPEP_0113547406 /NCGR_PEP_ID=MMETSP0015_2-20120614/12337_1 /TAXON_ID=2838 /ORGANISM="Odontella" /LENGTH=215 /DNA_ID=CAMNT_0000447955 /DNA_START=297 /DNA_END=944 /DNA_ORIENTATION=+ /assembly_acc=CAM_ASM_000160